MTYAYGYGELEDKLIELFRSGAPDFEAAQKLLDLGADLNAEGKDEDENILSDILHGYWWTEYSGKLCERIDTCEKDDCHDCIYNVNRNPESGKAMCDIIRFFLDHGFDVDKNDGCYGAQCLYALTLSTFDKYYIQALKMLFAAGAVNRTISPTAEPDNTPMSFTATEASYQSICDENPSSANIYEAAYQLYLAVQEGRPWSGIDSYETATGKKIHKVLADVPDHKPVFYLSVFPGFRKDNCFNATLYFVCDDCILTVTQYNDLWTDTVLPDMALADVSEYFPGIVGSRIEGFEFNTRTLAKGMTHYTQPITRIITDSGHDLCISINFGEVREEDRAAYFEIR